MGGCSTPTGAGRRRANNPREDWTMRQIFAVTDVRKRIAFLTLLSFIALC
jgi:hypothetical protein